MVELSKMPYVCLRPATIKGVAHTLENDAEISNMINALIEFIYDGVEPTFNSKHETGVWEILIGDVLDKANAYQKKVEDNKKNGKYGEKGAEYGKLGGRPRKGETKEEAKARRMVEMAQQPKITIRNNDTSTFNLGGLMLEEVN